MQLLVSDWFPHKCIYLLFFSCKEIQGIFQIITQSCHSSSVQGTVIIIANHGDRIDIPAGSMLENKIVSGNLRIMDH